MNIAVKSINKVTKLKEIIANKRSSDLLVKEIFLVSTIRNVKKTVWKTQWRASRVYMVEKVKLLVS